MIIVNFKTYKEASGESGIDLALKLCNASKDLNIELIISPQTIDLKEMVEKVGCSVWAQHIDAKEQGKTTGFLPAQAVKEAGAEGVLLNHSEHKLSVGELGEALSRSKEAGLKTLVFADSLKEALVVSQFNPDFIGYEPPELIASPDTSVAKAKPEVIKNVIEELPNSKILVGAGVKDSVDVETSIRLGAVGVVLSSAIVLAEDPTEVLKNLSEGFKNR